MIDSTSPLQAIKQKEAELRHRVEEAHRRAEGRLQSARAEAEQTIARAVQQGQAEARALYEQKIEETGQEAKAIVAAAHQEAATFRRQATARLDEAVRQIVKLVLPSIESLPEDAGLADSEPAGE